MQTVTTETKSQKLIIETFEIIKRLKAEFDEDSRDRKEWFDRDMTGLNMENTDACVALHEIATAKREMRHAEELEQVRWTLILKLKNLSENQSGKAKELISQYNKEYEANLAHRESTISSIEKQCASSKNQAIAYTHRVNGGIFEYACYAIIEDIEKTQ